MTLWLFKLIGMMTMLKSLELSGKSLKNDQTYFLQNKSASDSGCNVALKGCCHTKNETQHPFNTS